MSELSKQLKQRAKIKGHIEVPKEELKIPEYAICKYCEHVSYSSQKNYEGVCVKRVPLCKKYPRPTRLNPVNGHVELLDSEFGSKKFFFEECKDKNPIGKCADYQPVKRKIIAEIRYQGLQKYRYILLSWMWKLLLFVVLIIALNSVAHILSNKLQESQKETVKNVKAITKESEIQRLSENWIYGYSENQCLYNFNSDE